MILLLKIDLKMVPGTISAPQNKKTVPGTFSAPQNKNGARHRFSKQDPPWSQPPVLKWCLAPPPLPKTKNGAWHHFLFNSFSFVYIRIIR